MQRKKKTKTISKVRWLSNFVPLKISCMAKGTTGIERKQDSRESKELNGKHNSQSRPEKITFSQTKHMTITRETRNRSRRFQKGEVAVIQIPVLSPLSSLEVIAELLSCSLCRWVEGGAWRIHDQITPH